VLLVPAGLTEAHSHDEPPVSPSMNARLSSVRNFGLVTSG